MILLHVAINPVTQTLLPLFAHFPLSFLVSSPPGPLFCPFLSLKRFNMVSFQVLLQLIRFAMKFPVPVDNIAILII